MLPAGARPLYDQLDPETYGGAMLLGVDGVCIISHGSSSATAIVNADPCGPGDGRRRRRRAAPRPADHAPDAESRPQADSQAPQARVARVESGRRRRSAPTRGAICARRDPRRARPARPQGVFELDPRPPGRHPRDRPVHASTRATRSPTTSTPTRSPSSSWSRPSRRSSASARSASASRTRTSRI